MTDPKTVRVVVACVTNPKRQLLLVWNKQWGGFTLPMTKPDGGPPSETTEQAAVRAAAEATGRPVRVAAEKPTGTTRDLLRSARDAAIKNYVYTVVPIEVHPDFAAEVGAGAAFWADAARLDAGEYEPLTDTVPPLLAEFRNWGWIG